MLKSYNWRQPRHFLSSSLSDIRIWVLNWWAILYLKCVFCWLSVQTPFKFRQKYQQSLFSIPSLCWNSGLKTIDLKKIKNLKGVWFTRIMIRGSLNLFSMTRVLNHFLREKYICMVEFQGTLKRNKLNARMERGNTFEKPCWLVWNLFPEY